MISILIVCHHLNTNSFKNCFILTWVIIFYPSACSIQNEFVEIKHYYSMSRLKHEYRSTIHVVALFASKRFYTINITGTLEKQFFK